MHTAALLSLALSACGIDPARIPDHALFAADGATVTTDGPVTFAVVGNTRGDVPGVDQAAGRRAHGGVTEAIVDDIGAAMRGTSGPAFVALLGDTVRSSSTSEWKAFDARFRELLARPAAAGEAAPAGLFPGVPVAGDHEAAKDPRFVGWDGAWPGVGAHIGYNRVGSWYAFDVATQGTVWRFLVLDSGKERLGSRWNEQMAWIPGAVKGRYDGVIVLMHDSLVDLGGKDGAMNAGGGPGELIEKVEDEIGLLKLRAVLSAGMHANQAILPAGPFGALHLGAGGGGAPIDDLRRWGPGDAAGILADVQLEPRFDLALMGALDDWNREHGLPALVIDRAKALNSFTGFTGTYDGGQFPTYGWWKVTVNGPVIEVVFRHRLPDGRFENRHRLLFDPGNGWRGL